MNLFSQAQYISIDKYNHATPFLPGINYCLI